MVTGSPSEVAREVLALALARPPSLGDARLVCVDGPAGSGKTTLTAALLAATEADAGVAGSVTVVHLDDLYDGWEGLPRLGSQLGTLLGPLAEGRPGTYQRYDWFAGRYAEVVEVAPADLLVVEGVGAGSRAHADLTTVLVWVEAPDDLRLRRGLARDGAEVEPQWRRWMASETAHHAAEGTRGRADLLVDGTVPDVT